MGLFCDPEYAAFPMLASTRCDHKAPPTIIVTAKSAKSDRTSFRQAHQKILLHNTGTTEEIKPKTVNHLRQGIHAQAPVIGAAFNTGENPELAQTLF